MRTHIDQTASALIRHPPGERSESRVEGGGAPRHERPPVRALVGSPEAIARAIEDLGRSGYRPLRSRPMAPDPASLKHAWDGGADRDAATPSPVKEEPS